MLAPRQHDPTERNHVVELAARHRLPSGIAAPTTRADDFTWPRGVVNIEPAAVEPAAPDIAAPDAGTKSAKPGPRKSAMDAYADQTGRGQRPKSRR